MCLSLVFSATTKNHVWTRNLFKNKDFFFLKTRNSSKIIFQNVSLHFSMFKWQNIFNSMKCLPSVHFPSFSQQHNYLNEGQRFYELLADRSIGDSQSIQFLPPLVCWGFHVASHQIQNQIEYSSNDFGCCTVYAKATSNSMDCHSKKRFPCSLERPYWSDAIDSGQSWSISLEQFDRGNCRFAIDWLINRVLATLANP